MVFPSDMSIGVIHALEVIRSMQIGREMQSQTWKDLVQNLQQRQHIVAKERKMILQICLTKDIAVP